MGCNCGGGRGGSTVARSASGAPLPAGFTASTAILIGDENGLTLRVRAARTLPAYDIRSSASVWVRGAGVQALIDSGSLIDITNRNQLSRAWRVGELSYFDYQDALTASRTMGLPVLEVL